MEYLEIYQEDGSPHVQVDIVNLQQKIAVSFIVGAKGKKMEAEGEIGGLYRAGEINCSKGVW